MIVKGDYVRHKTLTENGVGTASHSEGSGPSALRWVVWRDVPGHWRAGSYDPAELILVGVPEPKQPALILSS